MRNWLRSGGSKTDEGLPEDTSAGNHLITWFSTRSHPLAQSNNRPNPIITPDPPFQPVTPFVLTSWRHPWDPNTTAFYENTHHEQSRTIRPPCGIRTSRYSESRTISTKEHEKRHKSRRSRSPRPSPSVFSRIRRDRSRSPRQNSREKEGGVFKKLGNRGKSVSARSDNHNQRSYSRYTEALSESEDSGGGHWKSRSKKKKSSGEEDDLSQPWVCEEIYHFTPRICYFYFPKTRMPNHIKTYEGSEDPEDHLKIFQAAAKTERWAMPTWCHIIPGKLSSSGKCSKDPIEIHNIKQRDGESTKDFVRRYKLESRDVNGASECMRISGFVHGITNLELIKRLHDKIPKTVDEMMRVTTSFLKGEVAASNHERKKSFPPWKQQEGNQNQNFKKGGFRN
ncbi:hypothetical protein Tco_1176949 [Tanacetum coccineum]